MALIGQAVSEKKIFEHCGQRRRRTDDGPLDLSTLIRLRICVSTQLKCLKKQLKFIGLLNKKQLKSSIRKGKNTGAYGLISLLGGEKSTRRLVPGSLKIRETAEIPELVFLKMAAQAKRGRKKANFANQTNKITGYLSHPKFDPSEIIEQLVDNCVRPGLFAATPIINNVIDNFEIESSSRHTGSNVSEKTLKTWTLKYPWLLVVNKESTNEMTLMCDLCSSLKSQLKLTNVFAASGSPRPKLKLCLFHLTLPTHQNSPYPNNFIAIFSCKFFFLISKDRICIAKAVPMQAGLKFV